LEKSFSLSFELLCLRDAKREDKDKEEGREKNSLLTKAPPGDDALLSLSLFLPKYILSRVKRRGSQNRFFLSENKRKDFSSSVFIIDPIFSNSREKPTTFFAAV